MIPGLIAKSPISYGWEGYDLVEAFSSKSSLREYEKSLKAMRFRIEKVQNSDECLQYRLFGNNEDTHSHEIIAASVDSEDDCWDIESYVGETEFEGLDRSGAKTIGTLFVKANATKLNESEQAVPANRLPAAS